MSRRRCPLGEEDRTVLDAIESAGCMRATLPGHMEAVEYFYDEGLTDGLPVVPPTEDLVEAMVAGGHLPASTVIGSIPQRDIEMSVLQAAVCAVMAGARPEYFPVVLASWAAILDPRFNAHGVLSSTGGAAMAGLVSGPYGAQIGMNSGRNLLGPGNRPNSTIGRAIRLGAMVVFQARPGRLDAASFGNGGKYSAHFAENDPPQPWLPLRVREGYSMESTTVTMMAVEGPRQLHQALNPDPEGMLRSFAACMRDPTQNGAGKGAYWMLVMGPEHAALLREGGLSQAEVAAWLSRETRLSLEDFDRAGIFLDTGFYDMKPEADGRLTTCLPEQIVMTTAGAAGAGWSAVLPCWTAAINTHPVTSAVHAPGHAAEALS
jgi:hypothetical protein